MVQAPLPQQHLRCRGQLAPQHYKVQLVYLLREAQLEVYILHLPVILQADFLEGTISSRFKLKYSYRNNSYNYKC